MLSNTFSTFNERTHTSRSAACSREVTSQVCWQSPSSHFLENGPLANELHALNKRYVEDCCPYHQQSRSRWKIRSFATRHQLPKHDLLIFRSRSSKVTVKKPVFVNFSSSALSTTTERAIACNKLSASYIFVRDPYSKLIVTPTSDASKKENVQTERFILKATNTSQRRLQEELR